ncbi:MAG: hypothetical protein HY815_04250 [Candidatus Riflebacteria bacterium]|nr:hypothetical protein [Candidatus Riflebacteria bacterium]
MVSLVLALVVLSLLGLMGASSLVQSSGTTRTYARVRDMRLAIDAGTSAIGEAVALVRGSMDRGTTTPECPADFRSLIVKAIESRNASVAPQTVAPRVCRELFRRTGATFKVSDVLVEVVAFHIPPPYREGATPEVPVGVMQFSVSAGGATRELGVWKRVLQRRFFYVGGDVKALTSSGEIDGSNAVVHLVAEPLGTVIE